MDINEAKAIVKPHLTEARYEHTLRVASTAVHLASLHNQSAEAKAKIELAAIFHDYAKYWSLEELRRWLRQSTLPKDLLDYHHELWHGPVASLLIEHQYGIDDRDIQLAIRYHTTGRANMTTFEMLLFLADYIEPGRSFPGVEEVRQLAKHDLVAACWKASKNTIEFLLSKGSTLYPDSVHAYNDLTRRKMEVVN
jgi:predicted HD superfamily hydrolase involved in NAD metabolism